MAVTIRAGKCQICLDLVSRQNDNRRAKIMPLLPPRYWRAPCRQEPAGLPVPGPYPTTRPTQITVVIFVVILIVMAWLLAQGYSAGAALETIAGAGVLAAGVTARLARTQIVDS